MTQQPFSRPGAIDLSGLKQPPPSALARRSGRGCARLVVLDGRERASFQTLLESSVAAPVVLGFYSPSRVPRAWRTPMRSRRRSRPTTAGPGRAGRHRRRADDRADPAVPQVPSDGDPRRSAGGAADPGCAEARRDRHLLNRLAQGLTAQGITSRQQPLAGGRADEVGDSDDEEHVDPRYAAAQDALANDDVDGAVAEYNASSMPTRQTWKPAPGSPWPRCSNARRGSTWRPRVPRRRSPDDIDAQTLVSDLDLLDGQVDEAFTRLVDLVRRTAGDERNRVREHLIGFAASGTTIRACCADVRTWPRPCSERPSNEHDRLSARPPDDESSQTSVDGAGVSKGHGCWSCSRRR